MPPFGGVFEIEGVNPRKGRGKTTEIKMVFNRQLIAALGVNGPDVLLYFLETAFDFPSCGIKLNHLFGCKRQVCGNQRERKSLVIDKNNLDLASEGFGHAEQFGKFHSALLAVNVDFGCSGRSPQFCGKLLDVSKALPEFGRSSTSAGNDEGQFKKFCVNAEPCEKFDWKRGIFPDFEKERLASEPTVANNEHRTLEERNYPENKFRSDAGLCLEPFGMRKLGTGFDRLCERGIKFLRERQTCPASVPEKKEPCEYPAMTENPFGGILFGGMVMMSGATGNLFPSLAVKGVVKGDEEPSGNIGNGNHADEKFPQCVPRQFAGIEEVVEFPDGGVFREKHGEFSENAADAPRRASGTERNEKCFENSPAVKGYRLGGFVDKFGEFHFRLLGLIKGYMHIIAYSPIGAHGVCCL
jgi:hypothetical protein